MHTDKIAAGLTGTAFGDAMARQLIRIIYQHSYD